MRQVFEPWLVPSGREDAGQVRREYRHLDLVIEFAGYEALVIENKTFALPDENQLSRYTHEAIANVPGQPQLLLLSLVDPGWPDGTLVVGDRAWQWVSYRQLAGQLAAAFWDEQEFAGQVIAHEAYLAGLLADLLDVVSVRSLDEPFRLAPNDLRQLHRANIADAIGKARAY